MSAVRKVGILLVGWVLVLAGIATLVLPGPGLLLLFAGLAVLSTEYAWARARVEPVKVRALKAAADSVETRTRIGISVFAASCVVAAGVLWGVNPPIVPEMGPFGPRLPFGGWTTGTTLILSGFVALTLVVVSVRNYRPRRQTAEPAS